MRSTNTRIRAKDKDGTTKMCSMEVVLECLGKRRIGFSD